MNIAVASSNDASKYIVRADPELQFPPTEHIRALHHRDRVRSTGRVSAAGDSAATENFFALLHSIVLGRKVWATHTDPYIAIFTWIERTYHRRRGQVILSRLTSI